MVCRQYLISVTLYSVLVGLAGCGTAAVPYQSSQPHNLSVHLADNSDQDVRYRLEVYRVNSKCNGEYQGTQKIPETGVQVGIEVGQRVLLDFHFTKVRWLHGSTTDVEVEALITPRDGVHYEAEPGYIDNLYDLKLYQIDPRNGEKKKMAIISLSECRPG